MSLPYQNTEREKAHYQRELSRVEEREQVLESILDKLKEAASEASSEPVANTDGASKDFARHLKRTRIKKPMLTFSASTDPSNDRKKKKKPKPSVGMDKEQVYEQCREALLFAITEGACLMTEREIYQAARTSKFKNAFSSINSEEIAGQTLENLVLKNQRLMRIYVEEKKCYYYGYTSWFVSGMPVEPYLSQLNAKLIFPLKK